MYLTLQSDPSRVFTNKYIAGQSSILSDLCDLMQLRLFASLLFNKADTSKYSLIHKSGPMFKGSDWSGIRRVCDHQKHFWEVTKESGPNTGPVTMISPLNDPEESPLQPHICLNFLQHQLQIVVLTMNWIFQIKLVVHCKCTNSISPTDVNLNCKKDPTYMISVPIYVISVRYVTGFFNQGNFL